jgi:hypothetical protein
MKKRKVRITNTGYLPDSPDRFNDMNIIPSNRITMKNVKFPILGTDNLGNQQMMMPGGEYEFPGQFVTEIPLGKYQKGKQVSFDEYMMEGLRPSRAYSESTFVEPATVREAKKDDVKGVTPKQKVKAAATKKKIAEEEKKEQIEQELLDQGEIKPATDGTERLKNQFIYAMDQPLDAVGSLMQRGYVPQGNLSGNYPTSSPMSDVIGAFNPASVLMDVGRVGRDLGEKETYTSWGGAGELGLNAAGFLPFGNIIRKGIKNSPNINKFKSEIDWAKWNKEIPENKVLLQEYDSIEQQTKANGTWMKNPDGSAFQGTPEQFVQQNSSNFKKAFGNSLTLDETNKIQHFYHGSPKDDITVFKSPSQIEDFKPGRTATTNKTEHIYLSPRKGIAEKYSKRDLLGTNAGKVYELYANIKNPYITKDYGELARTEKIPDVRNYDAVTNLSLGKNDMEGFHELAIPHWNYLKSAVGNNGMFDMTNPNIYKGLIPIIGAGYLGSKLYNQSKEQQTPGLKQGGIYLGKYEFKDGGLVKAEEGIQTNFRRSNVDKSKVSSLQKELRNAGYDLGKSGKSKDGVDGVWGPKTEKAYRDYMSKQSKQTVQADSSAIDPFVEEDNVDFTQQIAQSDSTKHNKALPNSLPQQAQQKNIQVVDVPNYPQSGLAVEAGFQPTLSEDKYAYGIKNPDYSIPADTLDPSQFYYESKRGVLDLPDGSKQAFMEVVPSQPIMAAMSGSVPYNPKEYETQAITEGAVAPLEYVLQKNAPNLYREDGSACIVNGKVEDRCAAGYQLGLDMNFGDKINRKDLGMSGDSWEVGQNIIDKGGSRVYGLTNDLDINPTDYNNKSVKNLLDQEKKKRKVDAKKITNDAQVGDVVEMWYKDSGSQDEALSNSKGNTLTTHSGLVSEKDGVKYVTHNIHGTWHTDKLEDVVNGKRKYMASGIVRPNYKVDENALGVKVSDKPRYLKADDEERGLIHEGNEWSAKQTSKGYFSDKSTVIPAKSTEANNYVQGLAYYAPQVQQDFKLSDNEMEQLMKLSFGVYGKESGFSHGSEYTNKRSTRKLSKAYKDIAPDWFWEGDELSSGPTQIKLDTNFNTDAEKALLAKYGIDDKNIWDEKTASGATLLEMARNYERFKQVFGVGFDNADPITMRNVLALAHNKGIDNVLKNEFTDISEAEKRNLFERAYDYATTDTTWEESKLKGIKRRDYGTLKKGLGQYANLHKDRKSYSNTVQDYSESLDVDYNKVKSNYWNAKTKERNPEEQYDITDWTSPSFIYDEKIDPIIDKASEQIDAGEKYIERGVRAADRKIERGLKALEKKTRSGVRAIKKKVRMQEGGVYMGTFEFKDGGLVRMQDGGSKEMPLDLPLKEQNIYLLPEYNQPINPETGEILPDMQRPNLGMDTGATEYKYTYGSDEGDIDVPSIVSGQYIGDKALDRYNLTGERFKTMNDPSSYSKFYDQMNQLGLMQQKNGGSIRKVKIKSLPRNTH